MFLIICIWVIESSYRSSLCNCSIFLNVNYRELKFVVVKAEILFFLFDKCTISDIAYEETELA